MLKICLESDVDASGKDDMYRIRDRLDKLNKDVKQQMDQVVFLKGRKGSNSNQILMNCAYLPSASW